MKKSLLLIAAAIFTLNGFSQTVPDYVPTDGLVGWWPFNGNANDESGNGNNGTVIGATSSSDRKGTNNSAYNFDYTGAVFGQQNDEIYIPYNSNLNVSNITVSAWVYPRSYFWSGNSGDPRSSIIRRFQYTYSTPTGAAWVIDYFADKILAYIYDVNNNALVVTYNTPLTLNEWSNITFTYDGADLNLYLNGILVASNTGSIVLNVSGNSGISIGESNQANGYWYYVDGIIDDIGIWNRALTACEVQELYNSQLTATPDNTITQSGNTLTANQTGAAYQWLDCDNGNAAISGATEQSYSPGVSGNFAVEVTVTDGSCSVTETSECQSFSFVGLEENTQNNFSVYPNPTKNSLTIQLNQLSNSGYTITDQLGKVVKEGNISSQKQDIDVTDLSKGVYVITVGEVNQKFIKE